MPKINLGRPVKDLITGFSGVAVARCEELGVGISIAVESTHVGEKKQDRVWIAESRLAQLDE